MPRPDPCRAVIFDLDGVLTDTAHLHFLAWRALAESLGLPFDEAFNERLKGVDRVGSLALILAQDPSRAWREADKLTLAARKNAHYQRLLAGLGANDLLPGAAEALVACRSAGLRIALASVSHNAPTVLQRLGITHHFDHVVDAGTVLRGKPDPEIFLRAAAALGVPPAECIGVEDAPAGIDAINAAGMYAIGVGSALRGADEVINDLRAVDWQAFQPACTSR
jgi:beta-phosphoglucomutase